MFPQAWRLTRRRDVQKIYRQGQSAATRWLFVRYLPHRQNHPRLTVIIGKKIAKKAVIRNRIKRLVRQAIQELMADAMVKAKLDRFDCLVTIHRDPGEPYSLASIKPEVAVCLAKLP